MHFERNNIMYSMAAINSPVLSIYAAFYGVADRHSLLYSARTQQWPSVIIRQYDRYGLL